MLGMKALNSILKSGAWLVVPALSLSRPLLASALGPTPVVKSGGGAGAKPLVFESSHPYEHNLDTVTLVKIKGAKRLSISFDEQSRTENGCDYVAFYTDESRSCVIPGADKFTGGKDGGESNWPGMKDRRPFIVEGDSFALYFHTDGSVNDWGWKMTVTPISVKKGASDEDEDAVDENEPLISPDAAALSCYYLQQLLLDGPAPAPIVPQTSDVPLSLFKVKPAPEFGPSYVDANFAAEATVGELDGFRKMSLVDEEVKVKVNVKSAWPKGFAVADDRYESVEVAIRKNPEPDAEVVCSTYAKRKQMLATAEQGDWVYVKLIACATDDSTAEGWVLRREGDRQFIVPDDTVEGCVPELVVVPTVVGDKGYSADAASGSGGGAAASGSRDQNPMVSTTGTVTVNGELLFYVD
jgi:hypothetical protein